MLCRIIHCYENIVSRCCVAGAHRTVRRKAARRRRVRPVRERVEPRVRDVRHGGQDGEDVELRETRVAADARVRRGRAGRVAAPDRAVHAGGVRQQSAVRRNAQRRADDQARAARRRLPHDAVQRLWPHVRRRQQHDHRHLLHGHLCETFRAPRPQKHGTYIDLRLKSSYLRSGLMVFSFCKL